MKNKERIQFEKCCDAIKSLGYDFYISKDEYYNYGIVTDGTRVGYVQLSRFGGVTFSTKHKPNKDMGSGFGLYENGHMVSSENITKEHIEESFIIAPSWVKRSYASKVRKWTLEEYLINPLNVGRYVKY